MSIVTAVVSFVVLIIVLWFCVYLFEKAILPLIPAKWLKYLYAILAGIVIIYLLEKFFNLRL